MSNDSGRMISTLAACSVICMAFPAFAEEAPGDGAARVELAAAVSTQAPSGVPIPAAAVRVDRGNGGVVVGADRVQGTARYARRSADVEGAADVTFSSSPLAKAMTRGAVTFTGGAPRGLPLARAYLTSNFGYRQHPVHGGTRMHTGVDLAAPTGTPVRATADGVVAGAGWRGGYGIMVSLGHGNGLSTRYAHLSAIAVQPGTAVKAGQVIGYVGATGTATGPHVHYEVRVNGRAVNPMGS